MSHAAIVKPFPRGALIAAAALIAFAMGLAAFARLTGIGTTSLAPFVAAESRDLRFADRADGAVIVEDARTREVVSVLPAGNDGFVRVVMRSLARERRLRDVGAEPPFRLLRTTAGQVLLEDPATGHVIHLAAFGGPNAAAFARLLEQGRVTP